MATRIHTHECRECGYSIECIARENASGCTVWLGSNDGCWNCNHEHTEYCGDDEARCGRHYPGDVPETPIREHDWYEEAAELRASAFYDQFEY